MMVLDRERQTIHHGRFLDFPSYFKTDDLLILNNTKVLPARLWGRKRTGGRVEVLLVRPFSFIGATDPSPMHKNESQLWECLIRSMKGLEEGSEIFFSFRGKEIPALLKARDEKKLLQFPPKVSVPLL